MELQTVTITRPETFLVWLTFARPDLEATQRDVEILLGYMAGHDYELVPRGGELFRHDVAEEPGEIQEYGIDAFSFLCKPLGKEEVKNQLEELVKKIKQSDDK